MKSFTASLLALMAATLSLTSALPTASPSLNNGPPLLVVVTLRGATPQATYSVVVPLSAPWGTNTDTSMCSKSPSSNTNRLTAVAPYDPYHLGISYVSYDHSIAKCHFFGVDEKVAPPVESNGQLGPPQTICAIWCECL